MTLMDVKEAIRLVGLSDSAERIERFYLSRGKATHHGTHLIDLERLTPESPSVTSDIKGRLESYVHWKENTKPVILNRELKVLNPAMGYEGTLDWLGILDGRTYVIDLKSSLCEDDWHRFQTALYALAWCAMNPGKPTPRRGALYLHPDGGLAVFREHSDRLDLEKAKGIITTAYILQRQVREQEVKVVV